MGWVVNATSWLLDLRERPGTNCVGGWVGPSSGLDGCGKSCPRTGIRSPNRPDRSESLYRLSYPGPLTLYARWLLCLRTCKLLPCIENLTYTAVEVWNLTLPTMFNPLNAELNPICHLLALLGGHHILHVSRISVNTRHWIFRLDLIEFCLMIMLL